MFFLVFRIEGPQFVSVERIVPRVRSPYPGVFRDSHFRVGFAWRTGIRERTEEYVHFFIVGCTE